MKLVIDCREKELIKQINQQVLFTANFKKIEVEIESLPIGDIIIKNDDGSDCLIIERKTIPDLLSSIKDGRYEEQSYRLNGIEHHNHNILYLIEGDTNNKKFFQKIDKLTFYSTIISLNYYKGFSVIKTQNLTESAMFICNTLIKIQKNNEKNKKAFYLDKNINKEVENKKQGGSLLKIRKEDILEITTLSEEETEMQPEMQPEEKDYVHVVKKIKKENVTTNNIDEIMLSQVPGISSTIAIAIISKYKSIKNIIVQYNNFIEGQQTSITKETVIKELFNDIFYINSKGDRRKISKTSTNNLYQYLLENK